MAVEDHQPAGRQPAGAAGVQPVDAAAVSRGCRRRRPSEHVISGAFDRDNGGAIPPNLLDIPNTTSRDPYLGRCKAAGLDPHPARFPLPLPEFFVRFLSEPDDLVLDPFAGSNVTGYVAERNKRRWLAFQMMPTTSPGRSSLRRRGGPRRCPSPSVPGNVGAVEELVGVTPHAHASVGMAPSKHYCGWIMVN
ncbi:MAG: DNA methyltransferase [Gemmataceae bacterium]